MRNVYVSVKDQFTANTISNALKNATATEATLAAYKKTGMARKTGKMILTIPEANATAKALEVYAKTTEHEPSAKLARSIAFGIRMRTAAACNAAKAAVEPAVEIEA